MELLGTGQLPRYRIHALLEPVAEQARGDWRDARSLAFLRSPRVAAAFALPIAVPDLVVVASAFHTKPLVSVLDGPDRFVVLATGDERAHAYEGTPARLSRMELELPVRAGEPREAWCRAVGERLAAELWDRGDPVVLAGAREHRAAFAEVSRYPYVLDEGVECDLGQVPVKDLHGPAREIVTAHRRDVEGEAVAQYLSATRETGATTDDLEATCRDAALGRVGLLLHRRGAHVWGRVDRLTGACRVSAARRPLAGDGDVVADLCQLVLQAGGDVVEVEPELMPTASPVAAVVRSPAWMPTYAREPAWTEAGPAGAPAG
jgi:hypothetical protein